MRKMGLPPGTPVYLGDRGGEVLKITILDYEESQFQETDIKEVEKCFSFKDTAKVTWINNEA